jgi:hypothetical protein
VSKVPPKSEIILAAAPAEVNVLLQSIANNLYIAESKSVSSRLLSFKMLVIPCNIF